MLHFKLHLGCLISDVWNFFTLKISFLSALVNVSYPLYLSEKDDLALPGASLLDFTTLVNLSWTRSLGLSLSSLQR